MNSNSAISLSANINTINQTKIIPNFITHQINFTKKSNLKLLTIKHFI